MLIAAKVVLPVLSGNFFGVEMYNWRQYGALAVLAFCLSSKAWANSETLVVYTENYPPYSFAATDGTVAGKATESVRQILNEAGVDYSFRLMPWARAMYNAKTQENALIYSLTWTPKRDPRFDWLAPLAEANFYLHARADDMRLFTPETVASGAYSGTCVANDLGCEFFLWVGMPPGKIIPVHKDGTGDFEMVIAGRADLYISDVTVNSQLRKSRGFDPGLTKPVMRLEGKTGFYLAAGKQVSKSVRDKVRDAYQRLKAQGSYTVIAADSVPH